MLTDCTQLNEDWDVLAGSEYDLCALENNNSNGNFEHRDVELRETNLKNGERKDTSPTKKKLSYRKSKGMVLE